ncbi:uncharacterized protein PpBr36_11483, partial [Pyricularia pennisetigena]
MSDVPASKQGTSPRLESPPCATSPVRMECSMPSVSIAGSQEPRLEANGQTLESKLSAASDANTQLRDCISTNETLKAALGFE